MGAPSEMKQSNYERLASINVNEHTEKKANLTYLSWAWAVDQLLRVDPAATWQYQEPVKWGDTVMVFCTVFAFGKGMTAQLPVMDHRNKAIANPDAFQVNTAMQRCLAKAIALHGLGLYIYAGEDLPEGVSKGATDPMGQDGQESANQIPAPTRIISAAEEAYKSLDDGDRDYLISAVSNAVKVYEKTPSLIEIDNYFMTCKLSNEQKAAIPYLLRGSKTKEGKNLHTAWVNYTKSETPLAEAV